MTTHNHALLYHANFVPKPRYGTFIPRLTTPVRIWIPSDSAGTTIASPRLVCAESKMTSLGAPVHEIQCSCNSFLNSDDVSYSKTSTIHWKLLAWCTMFRAQAFWLGFQPGSFFTSNWWFNSDTREDCAGNGTLGFCWLRQNSQENSFAKRRAWSLACPCLRIRIKLAFDGCEVYPTPSTLQHQACRNYWKRHPLGAIGEGVGQTFFFDD